MSAQDVSQDFFGQLGGDAESVEDGQGAEGVQPGDGQEGQAGDEGAQDDDLPSDPEALKAELLRLRKEAANAQSLLGRQGDELGQYRAYFDTLSGGGDRRGSPLQAAPGQPAAGVPSLQGATPSEYQHSPSSEYDLALERIYSQKQGFLSQGYDPATVEAWARRAEAPIHQAEMQRQMFSFASSLQQQQNQFQAFERAFWDAHPELKDAEAKEIFDDKLLVARSSGMYRNPVDAYEAAARATVESMTRRGHRLIEEHEKARGAARSVATPDGRGARPAGQAAMTPEQVSKFLADSSAAARAKMQDQLKNPSRRPTR